jgi:hypothetical protein
LLCKGKKTCVYHLTDPIFVLSAGAALRAAIKTQAAAKTGATADQLATVDRLLTRRKSSPKEVCSLAGDLEYARLYYGLPWTYNQVVTAILRAAGVIPQASGQATREGIAMATTNATKNQVTV